MRLVALVRLVLPPLKLSPLPNKLDKFAKGWGRYRSDRIRNAKRSLLAFRLDSDDGLLHIATLVGGGARSGLGVLEQLGVIGQAFELFRHSRRKLVAVDHDRPRQSWRVEDASAGH